MLFNISTASKLNPTYTSALERTSPLVAFALPLSLFEQRHAVCLPPIYRFSPPRYFMSLFLCAFHFYLLNHCFPPLKTFQ